MRCNTESSGSWRSYVFGPEGQWAGSADTLRRGATPVPLVPPCNSCGLRRPRGWRPWRERGDRQPIVPRGGRSSSCSARARRRRALRDPMARIAATRPAAGGALAYRVTTPTPAPAQAVVSASAPPPPLPRDTAAAMPIGSPPRGAEEPRQIVELALVEPDSAAPHAGGGTGAPGGSQNPFRGGSGRWGILGSSKKSSATCSWRSPSPRKDAPRRPRIARSAPAFGSPSHEIAMGSGASTPFTNLNARALDALDGPGGMTTVRGA